MDFAQQQRNPGRHLIGFGIVVALHVLLGWALVTGLAQRMIEVIKAPIETKIIEEVKPPEPPPPDCFQKRLGIPHLTWIFVDPIVQGYGVGTALLSALVNRLLDMGYDRLSSTFLQGNDSSLLWHWRNGFELLENPGSRRRMQRQISELRTG